MANSKVMDESDQPTNKTATISFHRRIENAEIEERPGFKAGEMEAEVDSDKETTGVQGELGEWLDQLQALSEELETVRPLALQARHDSFSGGVGCGSVASKMISASTPSINALQPMKSKPPPVPPKPPMDICRYSMANMEESADIDLDVLLGELYALENQLNNGGPNALLGLSSGVKDTTQQSLSRVNATSTKSRTTTSNTLSPPVAAAKPSPQRTKNQSSPLEMVQTDCAPNSVTSFGNGSENGSRLQSSGESFCNGHRTHSPDNDSAFCDSASMMSSESMQSSSGNGSGGLSAASLNGATTTMVISANNRVGRVGDGSKNGQDRKQQNRRSDASSEESSRRGSVTTPSPTQNFEPVQSHLRTVEQEMHKENLTEEERNARIKAEKIKLALQKMKEASVKKLYVKVFTLDGSSKSILVDERWTVAFALRQLADKHLIPLTSSHAVVEYLPDLFMERIYEDHENLVENLLMWTRDSPNKLYFVERSEKFHLFEEPQCYLLDTTNSEKCDMDLPKKEKLIEEFFSLSHVQPPEVEGPLYLKLDGKKAWKKHHFVLRTSGLYYVPKGKGKGSKDLVCLMNLEMIQIYNGLGWKKKYKAPTEFGFALKHPQIQVKASTYIKYLCAEDEKSHQRWMTGLRIAKSGRTLLENYQAILESVKDDGSNGTLNESTNPVRNSLSTCSGSDFYCKDSIVMRPARGVDEPQSCPSSVLLRPRSADVGRCGHQKRNSRTLTHVDVPILPNSESGVNSENSPGPCRRAAMVNSVASCGSNESQTPTPDSQSINGFDSEFSTGTIKRQPPAAIGPSKILPAYAMGSHHGARLPLTDSTKHIHLAAVLRKQSEICRGSTYANGSNGSNRSLNEENDSDEELPPPTMVHAASQPPSFAPLRAEQSAEFPPAPSPLPQVRPPSRHPPPLEVKIIENGIHPTPSPSSQTPVSPVFSNQIPNGNGSHFAAPPHSPSPRLDQDGVRLKKQPPAPPKRAENTRLSMNPPPIPTKPKPAIPAKPKLAPPTAVNANGSSPPAPVSPSHASANRPASNGDGFSNAFQNELQRAMQRRLHKMGSEMEGEKN